MLANSILYMIFGALVSMFTMAGDLSAPIWQVERDYAIETSIHHAEGLAELIDPILQDRRLQGALAGVSVRHAETGELLYSHLGDLRLHPASSMKILTAVSALEKLGADYRFSTELWTDGEAEGRVLTGNLYLVGKGDPTLMKEDLDQFAKQLLELGIERIDGHLIGDDSWYDDVRLSRDLNWNDEPYYTGTQISALTLSPNDDYDAGTVIVEVSPGSAAGEPAQVALKPVNEYVTVVNHAVTVDRKGKRKLTVEREHGTNRIIVEGTIPLGSSPVRSLASVWEPTGYAIDVFYQSLREHGIEFAPWSERLTGTKPEESTLLMSKQSIPLSELIIPFMKLSNNGHGEILTKELGRVIYGEGSWDKGLQVIQETLGEFGVDTSTIMLRDGSGMSHKTMIPADQLSWLLYAVQRRDWYPIFERSLPVAGSPDRMVGGTLRYRMNGTAAQGNVLAKTGSLTSVSSLSGYVTTPSGDRLVFSIMINNYLASTVKPIEDAIAIALTKVTLD